MSDASFEVHVVQINPEGNGNVHAMGRGVTAEDAFRQAVSNIASALSKSESEDER